MSYVATAELRFVMRSAPPVMLPGLNVMAADQPRPQRILQQLWVITIINESTGEKWRDEEWRDVPLVEEA